MAPSRARPRPQQAQTAQSQHQRSYTTDCDSDAFIDPAATVVPHQYQPNYAVDPSANNGSPGLVKRTNSQLNLSVLRRHNPKITRILSNAPFAVVYVFSAVTQEWEKSGVEGTLFVVQLVSESGIDADGLQHTEPHQERYAVLVLNRRGLENFQIELKREEDVEVTDEYIIVQGSSSTFGAQADATMAENGSGEGGSSIYGFWIFTEPPPNSTTETRTIIAGLIQECAMLAEASQKSINDIGWANGSEWDNAPGRPQPGTLHESPNHALEQLGGPDRSTVNGNSGAPVDALRDLFRKAKANYESTG